MSGVRIRRALKPMFLLLQRKYQQASAVLWFSCSTDDSLRGGSGFARREVFRHRHCSKRLATMTQRRARRSSERKCILEEQVKQQPDDADSHLQLAKLLAWLGENDAAIAEAQRATDLRPESKDAFEGPRDRLQQVAQVYAILGDNARAIELLDC